MSNDKSKRSASRSGSIFKKSGSIFPLVPPRPRGPILVGHQSEKLPGLLDEPRKCIVISQSGKYEEFYRSLACGFGKCPCILLVTPWGPYAIFNECNGEKYFFYLFDACSCTTNIVRYFDLSQGTGGLLYFQDLHHVIEYILNNRFKREKYDILPKSDTIDRLCYDFCAKGGPDVYKVCNKRGEMLDFYEYAVKECKLQELLRECPKIKLKCSRVPKPKKRESEMGEDAVEEEAETDCFKRLGIDTSQPQS